MENRFENKYVRNESTAKEIYKYWFFKRPLSIAIYVILGYYSLSCILGLAVDFQAAKDTLPILAMIAFYVAVMIISYRAQVKMMINRDREMAHGEELVYEIGVNDTEITLCAREGRSSILIGNLKYAFVTKNYIAVITKAKLMIILKKDSFTVGDCDGFITFLCEKGIKIRGKRIKVAR